MHGKNRKKDHLPRCAVWPALYLIQRRFALFSVFSLYDPVEALAYGMRPPSLDFLHWGKVGIDEGCGGSGLRFGLDDWNNEIRWEVSLESIHDRGISD